MCLFMPINYIMQNIYHSQMQIYYHLVHYVSFIIHIISSGGLIDSIYALYRGFDYFAIIDSRNKLYYIYNRLSSYKYII